MIYRNQCLDRLYLPRSEGGVGLIEINGAFRATIVSLGQYLISNKDSLMTAVTKQHRDTLPQSISIVKLAKNFGNSLIEDPPQDDETPATTQGKIKRRICGFQNRNTRLDRWKGHMRAGKIPTRAEKTIYRQKSLSQLAKKW